MSSSARSPRKRSYGTSSANKKYNSKDKDKDPEMGSIQSKTTNTPTTPKHQDPPPSPPPRRTTRAQANKEHLLQLALQTTPKNHATQKEKPEQKPKAGTPKGRPGRKPSGSPSTPKPQTAKLKKNSPVSKKKSNPRAKKQSQPREITEKKVGRKAQIPKSQYNTEVLEGCDFSIEERVLCYEPDPTKCRVLYEAKVLHIAISQDTKGKRAYEYLIHFQGWNSSWDRYVTQEFLLKDTDENRELQQELVEKADAAKKPVKGIKKKISTKIVEILGERLKREGDAEGENGVASSGASDDEDELSDGEEYEVAPVANPEKLEEELGRDYRFFHKKNKLVKLPATPSVVHILEDYVIRYGINKLNAWNQERIHLRKFPTLSPLTSTPAVIPGITTPITQAAEKITSAEKLESFYEEKIKELLAPVYHEIERAREAADCIRLLFDFYHHSILLYPQETGQHSRIKNLLPYADPPWDRPDPPKLDLNSISDDENDNNFEDKRNPKRKKTVSEQSGGASSSKSTKGKTYKLKIAVKDRPSSKDGWVLCGTVLVPHDWQNLILPYFRKSIDQFTTRLMSWNLVEKPYLESSPAIPSAIYGLVHLLRLFTKLPDLMDNFLTLHNKKLCLLMLNVNLIIKDIVERYTITEDLYISKDFDDFPFPSPPPDPDTEPEPDPEPEPEPEPQFKLPKQKSKRKRTRGI